MVPRHNLVFAEDAKAWYTAHERAKNPRGGKGMGRGWHGDAEGHAAAARKGARNRRKPIVTYGPVFRQTKVGRRSKSNPYGRYESTQIGGSPMGRRKYQYSRAIGPEPAPAGWAPEPRRRRAPAKKAAPAKKSGARKYLHIQFTPEKKRARRK